MFGQEATEHFEVVRLHEPNKIVLRCDGTKETTGKGEFIFTYTLVSDDDSKRIEINLDGEKLDKASLHFLGKRYSV